MRIPYDEARAIAAGLGVERDGAVLRFTFADGSGPAQAMLGEDGTLDVIPERCVEHRKLARLLA